MLPPEVTVPSGATPVTLSAVSESHRRWRRGNKPLKIAGIAQLRRPPVGTTFRFTLSDAAIVRFAFTQTMPGSRVRGRCVAVTREEGNKHACRRTVTAGSFGFLAGLGSYAVRFQGRILDSKKLKPGRYTLVITAINTRGSATARLTFTIIG
jgi:hypothetical protein